MTTKKEVFYFDNFSQIQDFFNNRNHPFMFKKYGCEYKINIKKDLKGYSLIIRW